MDAVEGREERDEGAEEREGVRRSLLSSHVHIWEKEEEMRRRRGEDGEVPLLKHLLATEIIPIMKRQERERERERERTHLSPLFYFLFYFILCSFIEFLYIQKILFNKISRKLGKIKKNVNFFLEINSFNKCYDKMHL